MNSDDLYEIYKNNFIFENSYGIDLRILLYYCNSNMVKDCTKTTHILVLMNYMIEMIK